jgi:hypothetical protein
MRTCVSRRAFVGALPFLPVAGIISPSRVVAHPIEDFLAHPIEDRYGLSFGPGMCLDAGARSPVSLPNHLKRIVMIPAGGQSNCSNTAGGNYKPQHPHLYNLNVGDGLIYGAEEPLLGCDVAKPGASSNFLTRLGDAVLLADLADAVVLVPWAISGVPAWLWSDGRFRRNVTTMAMRVRTSGLLPRAKCICIWQHGETDNYIGTPAAAYTRQVVSIADTIQAILGPVPFVAAQATLYQGLISPTIRMAQGAVANSAKCRYVGPDTDMIDASGRHHADCTHWNVEGARDVAQLWLEALEPQLRYA